MKEILSAIVSIKSTKMCTVYIKLQQFECKTMKAKLGYEAKCTTNKYRDVS